MNPSSGLDTLVKKISSPGTPIPQQPPISSLNAEAAKLTNSNNSTTTSKPPLPRRESKGSGFVAKYFPLHHKNVSSGSEYIGVPSTTQTSSALYDPQVVTSVDHGVTDEPTFITDNNTDPLNSSNKIGMLGSHMTALTAITPSATVGSTLTTSNPEGGDRCTKLERGGAEEYEVENDVRGATEANSTDNSILLSDRTFRPLPYLPQYEGGGDNDDAFSGGSIGPVAFDENIGGGDGCCVVIAVGNAASGSASPSASQLSQVHLLLSQTAASGGVTLAMLKSRGDQQREPTSMPLPAEDASNSAAYICASFADVLSSPRTPPLQPLCSEAQLSPHDQSTTSNSPPPPPLPELAQFHLDPFHPAALDAFGSYTPSKTAEMMSATENPRSGDIIFNGDDEIDQASVQNVNVATEVRRASNPLSRHPSPPITSSPNGGGRRPPHLAKPVPPGSRDMAALVHRPPTTSAHKQNTTPSPPNTTSVPDTRSRRMLLVVGLGGVLMYAHNPRKSSANTTAVGQSVPDARLLVKSPNETINVYYRPHITHFITTVSKHFDIAIFSAGEQDYVDALLDVMDPSGQVFPKSRRYYRQHCTKVFTRPEHANSRRPAAALAKDLQILGRPLNEIILVDDTPSSGVFQPSNLLLIPTWTGDPTDTALLMLTEHLVLSMKKMNQALRGS